MLEIDNTQISVSVEEILIKLREYCQNRFEKSYFRNIKEINDDIMTNCAWHKNGQESKPSMGINKNTGICHCFTCGKVASLIELIAYVINGNSENDGWNWLKENFGTEKVNSRKAIILEKRKIPKKQYYIQEEELDKYRFYHPYMWKRKLTPEIVELFDVGYDDNFILTDENGNVKGSMKTLTFPTYDEYGNCVFIARRSVKGKTFHYPLSCEKPVYALNKCLDSKVLFIVESVINCLTLWTYGLKAVALFGTGTQHQIDVLNKCSARHVYLCFDGDKAGRNATDKFVKNLKNKKISIITMIENEDVNSITKEQFFELLNKSKNI